MPRYEFIEGSSSKFWEITLDGNSYTTTYGKIGSDGKSTTKELASAEAAEKAYQKAIASKVKKGYELVGDGDEESATNEGSGPAPQPLDPAAEARFIAALKENPHDHDTYLAYAGWLQAQGHPRGDLIAVQHKRLRDPHNKSLRKAEETLLEKHSDVFFGAFAPDKVGEMVEATWYMGFIHTAKLKATHERDPDCADDPDMVVEIDPLIEAFLDHPSSAFIQHLTLGIMTMVDNEYDSACASIAARHFPTLQSLYIGDFYYEETELNWSFASSAGIYASCPNLRSLTVRSGPVLFGDIHAPELREFQVITGEIGEPAVTQICNAHWPKLERLNVMFGREGTANVGLIQDLLDAKNIPCVNQLGIVNARFTHAFVELLPNAKVLPQLDELDLRMGTLGDEGAAFIFEHKEAFSHLTTLNVDDNYLSEEGLDLLRQVVPFVYSSEQREEDDPGERYASMYE